MDTSTASNFVGLLFLARDIAHIFHLSSHSYAEHMALNEFYDEIVDVADDFCECYQGYYNTLLAPPLINNDQKGNIIDILDGQMKWIEANREAIVPRTNTALHNIIDEGVSIYSKTLYKLRFLH